MSAPGSDHGSGPGPHDAAPAASRSRTAPTVVAVLLGLCLTVLTAYLVAGDSWWNGPVLLHASDTYGLHLLDLPVLAVWALGLRSCLRLARGA